MKQTWVIAAISALLIFLIILFGINISGSSKNANNDSKLSITTSFYPLYFFTTQIAGDKADVRNLTPAGSEPHDYDPTTQDIARIEDGDILFLNGGVEGWGEKVSKNLKDTDVTIVTVGDGLLSKTLDEDGVMMRDPHIWLDPSLAKKMAAKIAETLSKKDPQNASSYATNAQELDKKLDALDQLYKNNLNNCTKKDIVTSHEAFSYLADAYGLNQVAISGLSPDAEPSAQQIATVADFAKSSNVDYIFFESLISPKLAETIAKEIGAKTLVLDPLEGLSDDDSRQGKNYFTVMENNLKNLQTALACKQ